MIINNRTLVKHLIFWAIILGAILILIFVSGMTVIFQTLNQRVQATRIAVPTVTAVALEAIYQKGLAYMNIGRWPEAKRELDFVFEIDPNYQEVQVKLIEVEAKMGELGQVAIETATPVPSVEQISTATATPTTSYPPGVNGQLVDLDEGLVAYYSLDDNLYDTGGEGNDGQSEGTPDFEAGRRGQAINLDGTEDYVNIGTDPGLTRLTPSGITLSAWIYNTQTLIPSSLDLRTIVGQRDPGQNKGYGLQYGYVEGYGINNYVIWIAFWGGYAGIARYKIEPNQWYHIAGVFEDNRGQIYVNGEPVETITSGTGYRSSSDSVMLGRQGNWSARYDYHRGKLDEVRIYRRALRADEIKSLAQ